MKLYWISEIIGWCKDRNYSIVFVIVDSGLEESEWLDGVREEIVWWNIVGYREVKGFCKEVKDYFFREYSWYSNIG